MAQIKPIIKVELNPLLPVSEICAVISAVIPYQPEQEEAILVGIQESISKRLIQLRRKGER